MKTCRNCENQFYVPEEDERFYKRIAVPEPSLCFACRHKKRLAFRNEINLYHRNCDKTGKKMITMYAPEKPYKIYDQEVWWGDGWDPMEFGQDYDFGRPFFEQYKELQMKVPRMSLNNIKPENSEYCNLALGCKNCYLVFTGDYNEDCQYLRFSDKNFKCLDCDYTYNSTECYGCIDVEKGNRCIFSQKCQNSNNLLFCYDMIGCNDCIGCVGLRNKSYYIFNESYSKEDYEKFKAGLQTGKYSTLKELETKFREFKKTQIHKYSDIVNCENSTGDYLRDCKNAQMCFNGKNLEDCKYMINCFGAKDCYDWDFVGGRGSELCHEMASSAYGMVNCHFCSSCWENCLNLYYSELCLNSKYLFGCISLRHKQYCILNKQYSKEEYESMMPKIIEHMKSTGEWGEFFSEDLSTFDYTDSVAQEYFPVISEKAEVSLEDNYQIPDDIKEIDEKTLEQPLKSEVSGKAYKITRPELIFLKTLNLPIPRKEFKVRHSDRIALRNGWALYQRPCSKCGMEILSSYAPERPEPVYCDECYKAAIY